MISIMLMPFTLSCINTIYISLLYQCNSCYIDIAATVIPLPQLNAIVTEKSKKEKKNVHRQALQQQLKYRR